LLTKEDIKNAKKICFDLLSNYYHGFTIRHTLEMISLLDRILPEINNKSINLRKDVLVFSIFLHDIGRVKDEKNHAKISFEITQNKFKHLINEQDISIIKDCITNHSSGSLPISPEAKLLQDLDKLSMLQPTIVLEYIFHISKEINILKLPDNIIKYVDKNMINFNFPEVFNFYNTHNQDFIKKLKETLQKIKINMSCC